MGLARTCWSSGPEGGACARSGHDNTHALRPTTGLGPQVPVLVQTVDERDGDVETWCRIAPFRCICLWFPWNPLPNTGNHSGAHSNGTGNRAVRIGKVPGKCRGHSIWHRHCPIADGAGARKIFAMRNVWGSGWSQELTLSFVPDTEQRLRRTLTRTRYQRTRGLG